MKFTTPYKPSIDSIRKWILTELHMKSDEYDVLQVEALSNSGELTERTALPINSSILNSFKKPKVALTVQLYTQTVGRSNRVSMPQNRKLCLAACVETEKLKQLLQRQHEPIITLKDIKSIPNTKRDLPYIYNKKDVVEHEELMNKDKFIELAANRFRLVAAIRDAADDDVDTIQNTAIEAENLYGNSPYLDKLSLQLACACLYLSGIENKNFSKFEAILFSERTKLRGLVPDKVSAQTHKNNIDSDVAKNCFHFSLHPLCNENIQEAVNTVLKAWN